MSNFANPDCRVNRDQERLALALFLWRF